jgi:prevent-host-death family protein
MESVGSYEAKTHLPQLLERVAKGETITITKHGVPVARLVPVETKAKPDVRRAIEEILKFRQAHPLEGEDLKEWINQGRRL